MFWGYNEMLAYFPFTGVFRENIKYKQLKAALCRVGNKKQSIILSLQAYKANSQDVQYSQSVRI